MDQGLKLILGTTHVIHYYKSLSSLRALGQHHRPIGNWESYTQYTYIHNIQQFELLQMRTLTICVFWGNNNTNYGG